MPNKRAVSAQHAEPSVKLSARGVARLQGRHPWVYRSDIDVAETNGVPSGALVRVHDQRGKFLGSGILQWARQAMEQFQYKPTNLMISLLSDDHLPIYNWYVVNAVPKRLEISGINAANNEILVETLALTYQYFKYYDPASIALDAAAALSGSIGISL